MYINFLDTIGNVENKEDCIEILKFYTKLEEIDLKSLNLYHTLIDGGLRYFTSNLVELEECNNSAYYLWVDTGLFDISTGEPLYVSFYKTGFGWVGGKVGTEVYLASISTVLTSNGVAVLKQNFDYEEPIGDSVDMDTKEKLVALASHHIPITEDKKSDMQEAPQSDAGAMMRRVECDYQAQRKVLTDKKFYTTLYENLLFKDLWAYPEAQLQSFFGSVCARLQRLLAENKFPECYSINTLGTHVVINSSLIDRFGKDIYILLSLVDGVVCHPSIVESKGVLLQCDFSKEEVNRELSPIKFADSKSDLIFDATIEDFDLSNTPRLEHILIDRRERFPEIYDDYSMSVLYAKLVDSVKFAIKMSERDSRYILPMYSVERDKIQFLIPFHLNKSVNSTPSLVIIVGRDSNSLYNVMTVLPTDLAYVNNRVINPYSESWLKVK